MTDLESETNVVSSSSDEKKNSSMTTSFVTHCASPAISPIAEATGESKAAGGTATESVIERTFVVVSKQGGSDGAKVDDEVASVLLTTERQDSGTHTSTGFALTQLNDGNLKIFAGIPPSPTTKDAAAPEKNISPDAQAAKVDAEKKLESWGKPMGLPSPKRPSSPAKKHSSSARKKTVSSSSSPAPPVYMDLGRIFILCYIIRI